MLVAASLVFILLLTTHAVFVYLKIKQHRLFVFEKVLNLKSDFPVIFVPVDDTVCSNLILLKKWIWINLFNA